MSRGYQKIILKGNVGRDPEMRQDGDGNDWCSFSVAVNDGYGVKWFNISAKGGLARIVGQYVRTGMEVMVDGVLGADKETGTPRVYQNKSGNYAASFDVLAREVIFSGGKDGNNESAQETQDFAW